MGPERCSGPSRPARPSHRPGTGIEIIWHAGEPLTIGRRRFAELMAPFEPLRQAGLVEHSVQTNAVLLNPAWCEFLTGYGFRVGVSIDGPAALNQQRVDWAGRPAFDRIMKGIGCLREHDVRFSAMEAARQRRADEQAERQRAERARTGADIDLTWSEASASRWTVTGSGHDRRLDVTLNTTDFSADMYEIRENGHFISRHPYRHQTEAAVRQLLADGVEIGERAPGPTLVASTYPNGRRRWRAGLPLNGLARS
ncbi:radical SAM protein [Kitasatospora sp. NPDC098663]|uniref:radical SAM protein n=1 Tax=Kitasatospora sp. NPDC098663 TaxID=3364096 RepID=UPI0038128354